ncbi:hypothetical protein DFH08DRAFT_956887 [Mycena albidolilacea]|uniref:Uncharacterized protein n=1 Tax=Mycena albidolilacea TaxID=1033008 RepID=A0AAD7EU25_9AGAR|nr:hypothetical protein DFH08DRAFT_956887 [Mycena albidolilacea]
MRWGRVWVWRSRWWDEAALKRVWCAPQPGPSVASTTTSLGLSYGYGSSLLHATSIHSSDYRREVCDAAEAEFRARNTCSESPSPPPRPGGPNGHPDLETENFAEDYDTVSVSQTLSLPGSRSSTSSGSGSGDVPVQPAFELDLDTDAAAEYDGRADAPTPRSYAESRAERFVSPSQMIPLFVVPSPCPREPAPAPASAAPAAPRTGGVVGRTLRL